MNETQVSESQPKFTKGEKCILAHLVLTIGGTIILLIIYLVHIFDNKHSGSTAAFDTRRRFSQKDYASSQILPIGLLYVNITTIRNICNTLLLSQGWSISTGHCVAMRSDPDLSHLLYEWRIKYPYNNATLKIKRTIVHPHFNRDTFANNVGLLQHNSVKEYQRYKVPEIHENHFNDTEKNKLAILSWDHGSFGYKGGKDKILIHNVQLISMENCTSYISPIIELRTYEFCIVLKKKIKTALGHGATIVDSKDFHVFGIFTWGERQQKFLPSIALNLSHFKDWLDSVTLFIHG